MVGAVIVEGYISAGPDAEEFPIVPDRIFEIGLRNELSLRALYSWISSHKWLPKEGVHLTSGTSTVKFGVQRLRWGNLRVKYPQTYFPEFVEQTSRLFQ